MTIKNKVNWDIGGYSLVEKDKEGNVVNTRNTKHKRGTKTVYDLNGKKQRISTYDYDDYIGFHRNFQPDKELINFANDVFNKSEDNKNPAKVYEANGCGHISYIEYAENEMILRVTFWDNSICLFFRVPTAVAGTLLHYAETGATCGTYKTGSKKGEKKHVLGVEFWNLVRIRGQIHGARYKFEYEQHSNGVYTQPGSHRIVYDENTGFGTRTLDDASLYITDTDGNKVNAQAHYLGYFSNDLNDRLIKALDNIKSSDEYSNLIELGMQPKEAVKDIARRYVNYLTEKGEDASEEEAELAKTLNLLPSYLKQGGTGNRVDVTDTANIGDTKEGSNMRYGLAGEIEVDTDRLEKLFSDTNSDYARYHRDAKRRSILDATYGQGTYESIKNAVPAMRKVNKQPEIWTSERIKDFCEDRTNFANGNPRDRKICQDFIANGDYEAAFNLLMSKKREYVYNTGKDRRGKIVKYEPYIRDNTAIYVSDEQLSDLATPVEQARVSAAKNSVKRKTLYNGDTIDSDIADIFNQF